MNTKPFLSSSLLLLFAIVLSLAIGSVFISPSEIWQTVLGRGTDTATAILWKIRLPRTVLIALTGAALGGSGATYQGLFRNPLADQFLIGVASGAALGAVIAMSIKWPYTFWGLMAIPMSAFVARIAHRLHRLQPGARRSDRSHHQSHPRRRGILLVRDITHIVPHAPHHR